MPYPVGMATRTIPRLALERERPYQALLKWLNLTVRPRTIEALQAAGVAETNARRWRKQFDWDSRTRWWDQEIGEAPSAAPKLDDLPPGYDTSDPLYIARQLSGQRVSEYMTALHDIAMDTQTKTNARIHAIELLLGAAGVVKPSRPKELVKDPAAKAKRMSDAIAGKLDPDRALELLQAMEAADGGEDSTA